MTDISLRAEVSPTAIIGENVTIGPFCVIDDDVVIGEGSRIGPHVSILTGSRLGKHCQVFPGAVIGGVPQDLKFAGEYSTVEIGDYNTIRENVTINRGTKSKGRTKLGNNNLIMAGSHLGHDCTVGDHCIIGYSVGIAGEVEVNDFVNISGLSGIHQFSKIGSYAIIAGLSRVTKDVPPYCMAARDPLSFVGLNVVGLRRRGFTSEQIEEIRDIYRELFKAGQNTTQAVFCIEERFAATPIRNAILTFIHASHRGIVRKSGFQQI